MKLPLFLALGYIIISLALIVFSQKSKQMHRSSQTEIILASLFWPWLIISVITAIWKILFQKTAK